MPHVSISLLEGRSREVKERTAAAIQEALAAELAVKPELISVSFKDLKEFEWKDSISAFQEEMLIEPSWLKAKNLPVKIDLTPASRRAEKSETESGCREVLLSKTVLHQAVRLTSPSGMRAATLK